jgi:hypothetical protein
MLAYGRRSLPINGKDRVRKQVDLVNFGTTQAEICIIVLYYNYSTAV